jgi:hypothetical protein
MEYSYIRNAYYKGAYQIFCEFTDGKSGVVDISVYINDEGIFSRLKDENFAKHFQLIDGVLTWGDGELDIAPETIYHKATGTPLPVWMDVD